MACLGLLDCLKEMVLRDFLTSLGLKRVISSLFCARLTRSLGLLLGRDCGITAEPEAFF